MADLVTLPPETLGGVTDTVPFARRFSAWGLLALLIAVVPANVHMAMEGIFLPIEGLPQSELGLWIRLPFQAVIALGVASCNISALELQVGRRSLPGLRGLLLVR